MLQVPEIPDFHAVKFNDNVATSDAAFFRRTAFANLRDLSTVWTLHVEFFCEIEVNRAHADAEPAAHYLPVFDELRHDTACHVARNGKPDADVPGSETARSD